MKHIRLLIYRLGFRPKYGSIFYSPTLSYITSYDRKLFSEAAKHYFDTGNDSCEASKTLELHYRVHVVLQDSFGMSQDQSLEVINKLAEAGVSFRTMAYSVKDEK